MENLANSIRAIWHLFTDPVLIGLTALISSFKAYWTHDGSWVKTIVSWIVGVFSGLLFTDFALFFFELDPIRWKLFVGGVLTLTGENLMKWLMKNSEDPLETVKKVLGAWRKTDE